MRETTDRHCEAAAERDREPVHERIRLKRRYTNFAVVTDKGEFGVGLSD